MLLLMIGNGLQGTLLGVRGGIEGFSTLQMSFVMSAYFAGFLGGSRMAPELIRRVGHVRVFAALASLVSAGLILYPTIAHPIAWVMLRFLLGFCFSGIYVTSESWLNNAATNETRGQAMSAYMVVQLGGVVLAQGLMAWGDPSGFVLFVIPSVLVSISFAPILLSINPTPAFQTAKPMSIRQLFGVSPLGCVGTFLLGGVYSGIFGMAAVYGTQAGLSVKEISAFVAAMYLGGLFFQFPIGWISDRIDRRRLIVVAAAVGMVASLLAIPLQPSFVAILAAGFMIGGMTNPLYALLIAYTNDFLEQEDMAAASGGLIFLNGVGAISGPLITGWIMSQVGPAGFFLFLAILLGVLAGYAMYRMTQRPAPSVEETSAYAAVLPTASALAVEAAHEAASGVHESDAQAPSTGT